MSVTAEVHDLILAKLARRSKIDQNDEAAIRNLSFTTRRYDPAKHIVREGQVPTRCSFLIDGLTYRQKLTVNGDRSLCALQVPGDFIDLQNIYLTHSDHTVQALTPVLAADILIADLRALIEAHPAIARAMWIDALIEASILREWLLNIGRRDARTRIAHLLCEHSARLQASGVTREDSYDLPMTQDQIGDAQGLTTVHVHRVLKTLENDGLIERKKRMITITDPARLRTVAEFNELYLHLDQLDHSLGNAT